MRLDRFLVENNICSRSEAKKYIKMGRVSSAGVVLRDSSVHIDEYNDEIALDGNVIRYVKNHYYMLNKPAGCVSATKDGLSATVIDMLADVNTNGLFPVGRLDKDTEGLLIITDDGKLAHELLSPKKHVDKTYFVIADRILSREQMESIRNGIDIGDDKLTLPAQITDELQEKYAVSEGYGYLLKIHEGRFHQVKRMFEKCGSNVVYLKRVSMGNLELDDTLEPGQYRELTMSEVDMLKSKDRGAVYED